MMCTRRAAGSYRGTQHQEHSAEEDSLAERHEIGGKTITDPPGAESNHLIVALAVGQFQLLQVKNKPQ